MAPTPTSNQTPSSKPNHTHSTHSRTPQSKHRLNFNNPSKPSPNPKENPPADHPVEVIGRIRSYPDRKDKPISALKVSSDHKSLMVRTDVGYREFRLDGISLSEEDDLDGFYRKFVESRVSGVKMGEKCTVMMYGPTGSGKSHTMFGFPKQPGIVYKSLKDILGGDVSGFPIGTFVQVTVLEIYNEEIYDLLSSGNGSGLSLGCPKGGASKVKLEVMGKKAKNATYIAGSDAAKISKEIQKVEKRRIVKSTFCNERSSRSHCMIILDVPTVGGRLMLVDMAGSENIEQAGQTGLEAKLQTAKINQGNTALKRVVESIANGDSHVPFRDSKLTMLLQDSFEDDKSKMLMVLCASPDPKEMHKTICTLEYGAKAKCIIRGPHTPDTYKICSEDPSSAVVLGSRIAVMDQFILKLQKENKQREEERNEAHKQLMKKEEEVSALRAKLALVEGKGLGESEEVINLKVNERTQMLRVELEKKLQECTNLTNEFLELEKKKMEERILQQQHELQVLRRRLVEMESELHHSRDKNNEGSKKAKFSDVGNFSKKLMDIYANEDPGMEKSMDLVRSMDLDADKQEYFVSGVKVFSAGNENINRHNLNTWDSVNRSNYENPDTSTSVHKVSLSTVLEEVEEDESKENLVDEEVQKEVIEEKTVSPTIDDGPSLRLDFSSGSSEKSPQKFGPPPDLSSRSRYIFNNLRDISDEKIAAVGMGQFPENSNDSSSSRRARIQNIFTLCGNYRELSQRCRTPFPAQKRSGKLDSFSSPVRTIEEDVAENKQKVMNLSANQTHEGSVHSKENYNPIDVSNDLVQVHVKWEVSKEYSGKFLAKLEIAKDASLADLRKLIEMHLGADKQDFTFLVLGDPSGGPVPREKEATLHTSKLPVCTQLKGHLACLRPFKGTKGVFHLPLSPINNILAAR